MIVYQGGKLFVEMGEELVGVNISPTGSTLVDVKTTFIDGQILTPDEVKARFGETFISHLKEGEPFDQGGKSNTDEVAVKRGRPRK